jgi:HAE1 family hydrophobic/amphiphilic exporter-1
MWITRVSINNPVFATMVMVALMVLGLFSYSRLGVEQLPDVTFPVFTISVSYPGASPEQVENDVNKPIENALNTISGVKRIRSNAWEGFGQSYVEFRLDANVNKVAQDVRDKIAVIRPTFPRDVKEPTIERADNENDSPVASYALLSKTRSQRELSRLAEQFVSKAFERGVGVGRVNMSGLVSRQILIKMRPEQMAALGVSPEQVVAAVRQSNLAFPVGVITGTSTEAVVRLDGRVTEPLGFGRIVVAKRNGANGGAPIFLDQVAEIEDGERERDSIARMNGSAAVGLQVFKRQDANIVETGKAVKKAAEQVAKILPPDVELKFIWANSDWVESSFDGVKFTIMEGAALTVLIVFLFLASWRSTVITGLTLPISVISAFIALFMFGFTLNFMTLMALSLCIGLLIDDAIVVRENIVRHVEMGKDHVRAAREGTSEIGLAVLATTLSIVAVFLPIGFMGGIVGKFFHEFGITIAAAVLISMFVSFTLDPMLSSIWHDPAIHAEGEANPNKTLYDRSIGRLTGAVDVFAHWLGRVYQTILAWSLQHRLATLGVALTSFAASFALLPLIGTEFVPKADYSETFINFYTPVGSSIEATEAKTRQVEKIIREQPQVRYTVATINTGQVLGKNSVQIYVRLVDRDQRRLSVDQLSVPLRERLASVPGITVTQVGLLDSVGSGKPIQVSLQGADLRTLERLTAQLLPRLAAIPGLVDLDTSSKPNKPTVSINVKRDAASDAGLSVGSITNTLRALVAGQTLGNWRADDDQNYDVKVRLAPESRNAPENIERLGLTVGSNADGSPRIVRLSQVAELSASTGANQINRRDLNREIEITANVSGRAAGEVAADIRAVLDDASFPPGYAYRFGGSTKDMQESFAYAVSALALAVVFIYMILASQFRSFLQPLALMSSLPLTLIGVVLALLVFRSTLNMFSIIGIVMLMGLVTKNAILLIDFAIRSQQQGMPRTQALLHAAHVRLRPILMTTLAMIFGMLPLALALTEGSEQRSPMGQAVIGGVITSSLLTLVVVPVIYCWLDDLGAWARRRLGADRRQGPVTATK